MIRPDAGFAAALTALVSELVALAESPVLFPEIAYVVIWFVDHDGLLSIINR